MEVQVLLPAPTLRSAIRNELPAVFLLCCSAASGYLFCNPNPNRRGLCIVRDDFLKRHRLTHAVVPASCKKSRSACLLGCSGLLSLLTFCGIRERSNRPRKMGGDSFYLTLIFEQRYKFEHFFWNV